MTFDRWAISIPTPTGWSDPRLLAAYNLIDAIRRDSCALNIDGEFNQLLKQIDSVDDALTAALARAVK